MSRAKKSLKIKHQNVPEADWELDEATGSFDLKVPALKNLPTVSMVTVVPENPYLFLFAIQTWSRIQYPKELIEWVIVDDSSTPVGNMVSACDDARINYQRVSGPAGSLGQRLNQAIEAAKNDLIIVLDPQSYYFSDSVLAKARTIVHYNKRCVYSYNLGVYNMRHRQSVVLEQYRNVPIESIAFTKTFWQHRRLGKHGDGLAHLLKGKESKMMKLPFWFNSIRLGTDGEKMAVPEDRQPPSFYELVFDEETKALIDQWVEMNSTVEETSNE